MDRPNFPLSRDTKREILHLIFDYEFLDIESSNILISGYLNEYERLVEETRASSLIKSHQAICNIVYLLKRPKATRKGVETVLRKDADDDLEELDEAVDDAITLAVRLILMVSTGDLQSHGRGIAINGETTLCWGGGSLKDLVHEELVSQATLKESVKLEKIFNARNLERVAGIKIWWTNNLADHLRMRDNDRAVEVFHCASFLKLHRFCKVPLPDWQVETLYTRTSPLLPPEFIDETLRTLALLFPEYNNESKKWFQNAQTEQAKKKKPPLDSLARENGQLKVEERQIDNFEYWHDRLVILKQAFDEAEPKNMKQWWHDRRKRVQWYTFWVAIMVLMLTVFFGLVQSVEGALQVYMAFKSGSH